MMREKGTVNMNAKFQICNSITAYDIQENINLYSLVHNVVIGHLARQCNNLLL